MSKLDGDARGGAVLSVKQVTGKPGKFVGMGEKIDALEQFYPDRMASRILGMGDILSLIDKIKDTTDLAKAIEMEKQIRKNEFTLEDFLSQMQQVRKLGSLESIISMIPGMGKVVKDMDIDDNAFKGTEAIIHSMTPEERANPGLLNGSRRRRIADGSGRDIQEVNRLLKQFEEISKVMKMVKNGKGQNFMRAMNARGRR